MSKRAHKIKCWIEPFRAIRKGDKTCDLRLNDRDYRVGDFLMLYEFDPTNDQRTGNYEYRKITHILTEEDIPRGLISGFVCLSLADCDLFEREALQSQGSFGENVDWVKPDSKDGGKPSTAQTIGGLTARQYDFLTRHVDAPQPIHSGTRRQMMALVRDGLVNLSPQYGPPKYSAISAKGSKLLRKSFEREADRLAERETA